MQCVTAFCRKRVMYRPVENTPDLDYNVIKWRPVCILKSHRSRPVRYLLISRLLLIVLQKVCSCANMTSLKDYAWLVHCLTLNVLSLSIKTKQMCRQDIAETSLQFRITVGNARLCINCIMLAFVTDSKVMMSEKCVLNVVLAIRSKSRSPERFRAEKQFI